MCPLKDKFMTKENVQSEHRLVLPSVLWAFREEKLSPALETEKEDTILMSINRPNTKRMS